MPPGKNFQPSIALDHSAPAPTPAPSRRISQSRQVGPVAPPDHDRHWLTMFTELFRVEGPWPGQLAISARPRGGDWLDEEIISWRRAGIDVIVSLLEPAEAADLNLGNEAIQSEVTGIQFFSFPIVDRSIPTSSSDIHGFLSKIDAKLSQGMQPPFSSNKDLVQRRRLAGSARAGACRFPKPKSNVCGSNHSRPATHANTSAAT